MKARVEMDIKRIKQEYNQTLKRYKAGELYLNDNNISVEERENRVPDFKRIVKKLDAILFLFEQDGILFTDEEALSGFEEVVA